LATRRRCATASRPDASIRAPRRRPATRSGPHMHSRSAASPMVVYVAALLALIVSPQALGRRSATREGGQPGRGAPSFKVDPTWPLEMPNNWILVAVTGVLVDSKNQYWGL